MLLMGLAVGVAGVVGYLKNPELIDGVMAVVGLLITIYTLRVLFRNKG